MPSVQITQGMSGLGLQIGHPKSRSADGSVPPASIALPAGKPGALSARGNATVGNVTLQGNVSIGNQTPFDLYWDGGRRYGVIASAPTGNVTPFTGGAGDDLPVLSTPVVLSPQVEIDTLIIGDSLSALGIELQSPNRNMVGAGHLTLKDAEDDEIATVDLTVNEAKIYDVAGGDDNPFEGDPITKAYASNGNGTTAATLVILGVQDTTPA